MSLKAVNNTKRINAMSEELNIDEQIARIDASIEAHKVNVARAEALERLMKTEDFQLVMIDGYLETEANRVFNLLISPRVTKPEEKESYLSQLETIKNVNRYLGDDDYKGTVAILGINSKKIIEDELRLKQELIESKGE